MSKHIKFNDFISIRIIEIESFDMEMFERKARLNYIDANKTKWRFETDDDKYCNSSLDCCNSFLDNNTFLDNKPIIDDNTQIEDKTITTNFLPSKLRESEMLFRRLSREIKPNTEEQCIWNFDFIEDDNK
jgi:hypothetical protein